MKAIILAAGKATRLLPLTKEVPQSMLKIGEKTILEIQIGGLGKAGIEDIVVIAGYLSRKLEKFCGTLGIKTLFNPFYDVSGMAGNLWAAKEEMKGGFLFLYSDVLFDLEIIKGLLKNKDDICLAIKKDGLREEAEKVNEENGTVKSIGKDRMDSSSGEFIGIAKFSKTGAEKITKELKNILRIDLNASFINVISSLIKKGEIVTVDDIKNARFIDIDFPEDLKKAKELFD